MILGNLLDLASSVIPTQPFDYYKFIGRQTNDIGIDVVNYELPITVYGSIQPVPQNTYMALGLDWQKAYINIYTSKKILDIDRDVSGDKIIFANKEYKCLSNTDWFDMDGWNATLAVMVDYD
jgi:hypothetical protein